MDAFPTPNIADLVALIVILLGTFMGFRRGLSGELAHLISVVTAFLVGMRFFGPMGQWFAEHTRLTEGAAHAMAFTATIVGSILAMSLLRLLLKRIMKIVFEETLDKVGGIIAGFIRSSVFVIIVFVMMNIWPHEYLNRVFGYESVIGTVIRKAMPALEEKLQDIEKLNPEIPGRKP